MSKQPSFNVLDNDLPPPYSPTSTCISSPILSRDDHTSLFAAHLTNLRAQIASEQAVRSSVRDHEDSQTLALLAPHVEALLSSIAAMEPPPSLVEATMIPNDAVGKGWTLTDSDDKIRKEVRQVIRVERPVKLEGDKRPSPPAENIRPSNYEFDEWGRWEDKDVTTSNARPILWWSDEDMARRLAKHLQPDRPTARVDRTTVREHVAQTKEDRKASRWSLFKKNEPSKPAPSFASPTRTVKEEDNVAMTVKAEEITFRKQSELGIWESTTGWGVIVRVKMKT